MIFTLGSANTVSKRVKVDGMMALKVNYLMYNGYKTSLENSIYTYNNWDAQNFVFEPYFSGGIGGKRVRFEFGMGFALKRLYEIGSGIRVFPMHFQFGLQLVLGRKYE